MKKLSKVEKILLESVDKKKYSSHYCPKHGIYQILRSPEKAKSCPYCGQTFEEITPEDFLKIHG